MVEKRGRQSGEGYCIQILVINGIAQESLANKSFYIENISKGGFRFVTDLELDEEDRVKVLLRFPNDYSQEVSGRICYRNDIENSNNYAYGFCVLNGFYSLSSVSSR